MGDDDDTFSVARRFKFDDSTGSIRADNGLSAGKRTLTGRLQPPTERPAATGTTWIDHGAVCDRADGPDCFLDKDVRARLIIEYKALVDQARTNYFQALTNVRVDELVQKDEDLPWWATLLIGVISSQLASGIEKALGALKAGVRPVWLVAEQNNQRFRERVTRAIANLSDDAVKSIAKTTGDGAKDKLKSMGKSAANAGRTLEKTETVSFISLLQSQASLRYQQLLQVPPGNSTDAELLVLYASMDEKNHSIERYEAEIRTTVDAFKASYARKIGVHEEAQDPVRNPRRVDRHTKVAWIAMPSGNLRLACMDQDFKQGDPAIYRDDEDRAREDRGAIDDDPRYVDLVETEFVDVAFERHVVMWGAPPKTYELAPNTFPPRLRERATRQSDTVANAAKAVRR